MKNVFIISGPAGSGKDTIIDSLQSKLSTNRIITTTTRAIRPEEHEGAPYYFLSRADFKQSIERGEFVEHSTNENGELYGVTIYEFERVTKQGGIVIWRVDWKGVIAIKKLYPEIVAIFISSPIEILESRLRARDTNQTEEYFQERLAYTKEWLNHLDIYDYQVENEEGKLDQTISEVEAIITSHLEK